MEQKITDMSDCYTFMIEKLTMLWFLVCFFSSLVAVLTKGRCVVHFQFKGIHLHTFLLQTERKTLCCINILSLLP